MIALSFIMGFKCARYQFFFSFKQCKHLYDKTCFPENIIQNPIFSLLFFESRFPISYHAANIQRSFNYDKM